MLKVIQSGKQKIRVFTLLIMSGFIFSPVFSQNPINIDLRKVQSRKVREYIVLRSFDQLNDYSLINASCKRDIDESGFNVIEESFYLKKDLSAVWECYRHADPVKMWNGRSFRFGLLICKCSNSVIYANNLYIPDLDTGQVYFLNLRLMKGLVNVPVAFEIINIDTERRIMEFSYINSNKTRGKQVLEFFDDGDGRTRIVHRSYFKSESRLHDLVYPYFHYRFIEEFHRKMKKLAKNARSSDII